MMIPYDILFINTVGLLIITLILVFTHATENFIVYSNWFDRLLVVCVWLSFNIVIACNMYLAYRVML